MQRRTRQEKTLFHFGSESMPDKIKKSSFVPAIEFITDNGIPRGFQMGADLMQPSCFGKTPDKGKLPGPKNFSKSRQGRFCAARFCPAFLANGGFIVGS